MFLRRSGSLLIIQGSRRDCSGGGSLVGLIQVLFMERGA